MMINNITWDSLSFSDIFDKILIAKSTDLIRVQSGNIPFIGRSSINNGFQGEYEIPLNKVVSGNSITISMVGLPKAFYQKFNFTCSQNILILQSKLLNENNALFLCSIINEYLVSKNYNYGHPVSLDRFKKDKIMVPVINNKPDFKMMSIITKNIKESQKKEYKKYALKLKKQLGEYNLNINFTNVEWEPFEIGKICDIYSGHDIYAMERVPGNLPYITSSSINNGIKYFVSNVNETYDCNAISVNRNGSVGHAFYHKYYALYSNDCRKIKLKVNNNEYTSLFITNQIMAQKDKYGYGYKFGTERLKKQCILLPKDKNNTPDYNFMEKYIKNIIIKKIDLYLEFIE